MYNKTSGTDIPVCHLITMLEIHRRQLPHWTFEGAVYYITFRLFTGSLTTTEILLVLDHIKSGHGRFYSLYAVQIMPNHVHLILKPNENYSLSRIMKGIKGVTARLINIHRSSSGTLWLDESFDRIIRNQREFDEKLKYMYENPVSAGLVVNGDDYCGWFIGSWE